MSPVNVRSNIGCFETFDYQIKRTGFMEKKIFEDGFYDKKYDFCGLLEGCLKSGSHLQKKKKFFYLLQ